MSFIQPPLKVHVSWFPDNQPPKNKSTLPIRLSLAVTFLRIITRAKRKPLSFVVSVHFDAYFGELCFLYHMGLSLPDFVQIETSFWSKAGFMCVSSMNRLFSASAWQYVACMCDWLFLEKGMKFRPASVLNSSFRFF